jgi:UDP-N-acetylmuramate: L-alanyl-gamma-D-glutamyl-meso-diaminopimelate ligase
VGNVVRKNSDEARFLEKSGVPFSSFPSALGGLILPDRKVVGVAGTHGKTTTTYLLVQIFQNLGYDPGYFIGGVPHEGAPSHLGSDPYFFIESDEYDSAYFEKYSKFHSYGLKDLLLTSLEFDHGDIFSDLEQIKDEFRPLIKSLKGSVIANMDYPAIQQLKQGHGNWVDLPILKILHASEKGSRFQLHGEVFETNLVGKQNILNLACALTYALQESIPLADLKRSILNLKLVKRRQEVKGYYNQSVVIDDFAHHPRSVEMTYEAIKTKYPNEKILVVFEPASATARSSYFQKDFAQVLDKIMKLILVNPKRPTTLKSASDLDFLKPLKN